MEIKVDKPTQQYLDERKVSSWGIWEKKYQDLTGITMPLKNAISRNPVAMLKLKLIRIKNKGDNNDESHRI